MMDRVACLREMVGVLTDMEPVAQVRDTERLSALNDRYRQLSETLRQLPAIAPGDPAAADAAGLLRAVLAGQQAVESTVGPWMDDLRTLFREGRNEKALAAAYRQDG